ncbi:cell wall integrity protein scw1 isoform X1 [Physcomitrium patens]|nr:cell wall integrity protein scw1-like isoform X1 [Physcomitrium patens]|eukprot:XP_024385639.1 cell wall integrity protein scw1-like isoform X1 [Physcomitrella patens]
MAEEEVKTLFLSGLPDDIKEREIYNLFRNFEGYESCQLKFSGRGFQIVAFAVFTDQATALKAKEELNGLKFDPQTGAVLHIELARANSRTKRSRSEDGATVAEKRTRGPLGVVGTFAEPGVGATLHMPGLHPSIFNDMPGFPPPPRVVSTNHWHRTDALISGGGMMAPPFNGQEGISGHMMGMVPLPPPAPGSNPPCSTLFIANLGPSCTEEELSQLLSRYPGFSKLKYQMKAGQPVAFVEFQDIRCSTQALSALQNSKHLPAVDRGGMRVEYAKAKMGQPRRDRVHP